MLFAVITAFLLVIMLLVVAGFGTSALRERSRRKQMRLAQQASTPTHLLDSYITTDLQEQNGAMVGTEKTIAPLLPALPNAWYTRRRMLVSFGFLIMLVLTLFFQDGLAEGTLHTLGKGLGLSLLSTSQAANDPQADSHNSPSMPGTASARIVRIDSAARNQYYTTYQWQVWSYSSCSGIAMEMVMNAYGRHLIAADVLQQELNLGIWNVNLGLLREEGIAMTASYYGFNTSANHTRTLQDLISTSNNGAPIIVSVRDSYYFPNGHIFVIRGGDSQYVYIADSSRNNFQRMPHSMFLAMWQGFSVVLTPR